MHPRGQGAFLRQPPANKCHESPAFLVDCAAEPWQQFWRISAICVDRLSLRSSCVQHYAAKWRPQPRSSEARHVQQPHPEWANFAIMPPCEAWHGEYVDMVLGEACLARHRKRWLHATELTGAKWCNASQIKWHQPEFLERNLGVGFATQRSYHIKNNNEVSCVARQSGEQHVPRHRWGPSTMGSWAQLLQ